MIRVTLKNEKQYKYVSYYFVPGLIALTNKCNQTQYYPYDSIKKLEKQVKDLTLEEVYSLNYFEVNMTSVRTVLYRYGIDDEKNEIYETLNNDDYIDITKLVIKGE